MNLTVVKTTVTKAGKHILKLAAETVVKVGVIEVSRKATYYLSANNAVEVGTNVDVDMELFTIRENDFKNPETGENMKLKWLILKM